MFLLKKKKVAKMAKNGPMFFFECFSDALSCLTPRNPPGCRKFCIQDNLVRAAALHKGDQEFCSCYTPDINLPLYDAARRQETKETGKSMEFITVKLRFV